MTIVTGSDYPLSPEAQRAWRKADGCLADCDLPMDIERAITIHDMAFCLTLALGGLKDEVIHGKNKPG